MDATGDAMVTAKGRREEEGRWRDGSKCGRPVTRHAETRRVRLTHETRERILPSTGVTRHAYIREVPLSSFPERLNTGFEAFDELARPT